MRYIIKYLEKNNLYTITTSGDFVFNSFSSLLDDLIKHNRWKPGTDCLFDHLRTNFSRANRNDFILLSDIHKRKNLSLGNGKLAFVMKDTCNFGLGRMYQGMTEASVSTKIEIFKDLKSALSWLRPDGHD